MAITQAICDSFRLELGQAIHDLAADTIKIALYTSSATLGAGTTAYSATNEVSGTGYSAGGATLASKAWTVIDNRAVFDCADPVWTAATITARGALIYNASKANRAIAVLDFGADIASTNGDFTITLPAATAADALLRI